MSINEMTISIKNLGVIPVEINGSTLYPNASATFFGAELSDTSATFENLLLRLEGNTNFDYTLFRYRETKYEFEFKNIKLFNSGDGFLSGGAQQEGPTHSRPVNISTMSAGPESAIPRCYLRSLATNVLVQSVGQVNAVEVNGMTFINPEQARGAFYSATFYPNQAAITWPQGIPTRDAS